LIGWIPVVPSFVLVAVTVTMDERGRYNMASFYTVGKDKIENASARSGPLVRLYSCRWRTSRAAMWTQD
jgi:hypothetical protein